MSIVPPKGGSHHPTATQDLLTWTCDGCGDPILSGFVAVRYADIEAAGRAQTDWDRRHAGGLVVVLTRGEMAAMPEPAQWHAWHDDCGPHPGGNEYSFGQPPTFEAVLSWTVHLMEKNWFAATDWGPFLRRQLHPQGC